MSSTIRPHTLKSPLIPFNQFTENLISQYQSLIVLRSISEQKLQFQRLRLRRRLRSSSFSLENPSERAFFLKRKRFFSVARMRRVSGSIVKSKPISLLKACSVLNGFVSSDNGATQGLSVFLERASGAFSELVQFHKELKVGRFERKGMARSLLENGEVKDKRNFREDGVAVGEGKVGDLGEMRSLWYSEDHVEGEGDNGGESGGKKKKKKKYNQVEIEGNVEEERREERTKRKNVTRANGEDGKREERTKRKNDYKVDVEEEQSEEGKKKKRQESVEEERSEVRKKKKNDYQANGQEERKEVRTKRKNDYNAKFEEERTVERMKRKNDYDRNGEGERNEERKERKKVEGEDGSLANSE